MGFGLGGLALSTVPSETATGSDGDGIRNMPEGMTHSNLFSSAADNVQQPLVQYLHTASNGVLRDIVV